MEDTSFLNRRREFLKRGVLCMAGCGMSAAMALDENRKATLRVGLLTDLHYGDKEPAGTRYYRETYGKLQEAVAGFNREKPGFVVELGDLIDKADTVELEMKWLDRIEGVFAQTKAPRHYVLGNHCVATLTKKEFAEHTQASKTPHYSFEAGGFHFVVLDACYKADETPYERGNFDWKDSNIPAKESDWLQSDLAHTTLPVIVFAHQRLDEHSPHSVRNAAAVRGLLEKSGKVRAVFQGHSHQNDYQQITGIHYCTLVAMIEGSGLQNSGYAMLDLMEDSSLRLHGFRRQVDREFRHQV